MAKYNFKTGQRFTKGQNAESKNVNWKGDAAGIPAIHSWVRRHLPKPNLCPVCDQNKRLDVHNIDKKYRRELSGWRWLCRKCHQDIEGITLILKSGLWPSGHKVSDSLKKKCSERMKNYHKNKRGFFILIIDESMRSYNPPKYEDQEIAP